MAPWYGHICLHIMALGHHINIFEKKKWTNKREFNVIRVKSYLLGKFTRVNFNESDFGASFKTDDNVVALLWNSPVYIFSIKESFKTQTINCSMQMIFIQFERRMMLTSSSSSAKCFRWFWSKSPFQLDIFPLIELLFFHIFSIRIQLN